MLIRSYSGCIPPIEPILGLLFSFAKFSSMDLTCKTLLDNLLPVTSVQFCQNQENVHSHPNCEPLATDDCSSVTVFNIHWAQTKSCCTCCCWQNAYNLFDLIYFLVPELVIQKPSAVCIFLTWSQRPRMLWKLVKRWSVSFTFAY